MISSRQVPVRKGARRRFERAADTPTGCYACAIDFQFPVPDKLLSSSTIEERKMLALTCFPSIAITAPRLEQGGVVIIGSAASLLFA